MNKAELVMNAIDKASNNQSKLPYEALNMQGFTSHKIKHLLNNLGEFSKIYGEVGVHKGAMSVAATYENPTNNTQSWLCDNWTLFDEGGRSREMFYQAMDWFKVAAKIFEQDCFTIDLSKIEKTDLYVFDGAHDRESQQKGIEYFYPILANEFVLCVDDTSWKEPKEGTEAAIKKMNLKILFERHLWDGKENSEWHNGFSVYLLQK